MKPLKSKAPPHSTAASAAPVPRLSTLDFQPSTILLAVTGMSPAVLTETIWSLAFPADKSTPPIIPDRVIALTTTIGRDAIAQQLFGNDRLWEKLRETVLGQRHQVDSCLCFGPTGDCVKVFTRRAAGKPVELQDVSTGADNTAVADFITDELWGHVEKPGTRLVASISGGFKTVSALLFAGMSLLGRKNDLITHVLVNAPYDTVLTPRFFFPRQPRQDLKDRDGKTWLARDAQLRLGFVPFVPLHDLLEKYKKPRSYSDLVERCRGSLDRRLRQPVKLRLWVSQRQVGVNDTVFRLGAQPFLFLLFLAENARQARTLGKYWEALEPFQEFVRQFHRHWEKRRAGWASSPEKLLPEGFDELAAQRDETPIRTKLIYGIAQKLRQTPGAYLLEPYLPETGRCTLDLPADAIEILD